MKALKAVAAILAVGTVLAGCGSSEWEGDVRFKVTKVTKDEVLVSGQKWEGQLSLELAQDQPSGAAPITGGFVRLDEAPSGVEVGDTLVCKVKQRDESKFDDAEGVQSISSCRKA